MVFKKNKLLYTPLIGYEFRIRYFCKNTKPCAAMETNNLNLIDSMINSNNLFTRGLPPYLQKNKAIVLLRKLLKWIEVSPLDGRRGMDISKMKTDSTKQKRKSRFPSI